MERKREVVLENTILENVFRYVLGRLRGMSGLVIERTADDGTTYGYCIQNVFPSDPNGIEVRYTTVVTPQGNVEKSRGYWGDSIAMSFEGLQLQTNTVLINGECHQPFILSAFHDLWADMLKAFGAAEIVAGKAIAQAEPEKPKQKGRYRLTKQDIAFRRRKVNEANKMKKDDPQRMWKEIDMTFGEELGIADRTFRAWRHSF